MGRRSFSFARNPGADTLLTKAIEVIPYAKIGVHGYGYYQPIVDTASGKVYALYAGGEVPGYLCWFIYDIATGQWEEKSYIVEIDHRNAYFHAYPDGKGSAGGFRYTKKCGENLF